MKIIRTLEEVNNLPTNSPRVFVPTMGALHDGHGELIRVGKVKASDSGQVVVSVFVNPLQFGPNEDFNKYPRSEELDVEVASKFGADVIWFPFPEELLSIDLVKLTSPQFGNQLEGAIRPGHFDGVLTIVNRFFEILKPDVAVFGVKDLQQLILIRQMAEERFPNLEVAAVETVRTESGLALSSRNKYLSGAEAAQAVHINQALNIAALKPNPIEIFMQKIAEAGIDKTKVDYAEILEMPSNCLDLGSHRLVVAVRVGSTRLLDNIALD